VRLHAIERSHWWFAGMRDVAFALLEPALAAPRSSLLDGGCGTGGFLAWAAETGRFDRLCGVDVSAEAIARAREWVPRAELAVAPLHDIPFEDGAFDVAAVNDVLQHVDEEAVPASLNELRRVLRPDGVLLVRTNGARRARKVRRDWRLYDAGELRRQLEQAGFRVQRMTYANMLLSLVASLRGRAPAPPTSSSCGIPRPGGALAGAVGRASLALEARYLRSGGRRRRLPYGHTLIALAVPADAGQRSAGQAADRRPVKNTAEYG
jgi:SAM-dependent methyltransferase